MAKAFSMEREDGAVNTGFVDTTGKEIFTGDIVRFLDNIDCEVYFDDDRGAFFMRAWLGGEMQVYRFDRRVAAKCNIIGNIN